MVRFNSIINTFFREPETAQTIALPNARKAMTRARGVGQPHTPNTLEQLREELVQPHNERFRLTLDGLEQFLLDGPIMEGNECVAEGFVSRRTIAHLARHPAEATHLMMDATFKTVPRRPQNMYQFFSIHVMYMDAVSTCCYFNCILLSNFLYVCMYVVACMQVT